jgi:outer membrane protein assembly factor BamA
LQAARALAVLGLLACCTPAYAQDPAAPEPARADPPLPLLTYVLEEVRFEGCAKTDPNHLRSLLALTTDAALALQDLELVRLRLLGTGFFERVEPTLQRGSSRGKVVLLVRVVERNTITLSDVFLGSSRRTPFWGGAEVVEGNLFGQGKTFGAAFVAGEDQYAARLRLASPRSFELPLRLSGELSFTQGNEALFLSPLTTQRDPDDPLDLPWRRVGGELGAGFYPLQLLGVFLDVGVEWFSASSPYPALTSRWLDDGSSWHLPLRLTLDHDTRDNPLVPTTGYRLSLSVQAASSLWNDYNYAKTLLQTSFHHSLGFGAPGHVLRLDLVGGFIVGRAPFQERFFLGDVSALVPSRALGLNYATLPAPAFLGRDAANLSYETVLAGTALEYGVPIIQGEAPLYRVEFFLGVGLFAMTTPTHLPGERQANLGVSIVPVQDPSSFPLELTFDTGFRAETPIGVFGLSFANGLALVPF